MDTTDYNSGRLYLLNDGHFRFVGRLHDVHEDAEGVPLLEMEIIWSPYGLNIVRGMVISCRIEWVVREAVEEDHPEP